LQQAIAKDPDFALAYVALAQSYLSLAISRVWPTNKALLEQRKAARRAVELDDRLGEAHDQLALSLSWLDWDWSGADREFRRAIELNTNSAHMEYGRLLAQTGRTQEALAEAQRAIEVDPLSPYTLETVASFCRETGENGGRVGSVVEKYGF